jgi:16S rRNA (guanine527-N7)-methyltransferase
MSISAWRGFAELLRERLAGVVELTPEQIQVLEHHYELLVRWNRSLNLTSIRSMEEAVERHYCESLFLAIHLPGGAMSIADIGSGAGFPGIPVAVLRPDCRITLIDAHHRKAVFLREASRNMPNVEVLAKRAENVVAREFDRAISRAVGYEHLSKVLKLMAPAADLLTGAEEPPEEWCFTWNKPLPLPWGTSRFLRQGFRGVSCETT